MFWQVSLCSGSGFQKQGFKKVSCKTNSEVIEYKEHDQNHKAKFQNLIEEKFIDVTIHEWHWFFEVIQNNKLWFFSSKIPPFHLFI